MFANCDNTVLLLSGLVIAFTITHRQIVNLYRSKHQNLKPTFLRGDKQFATFGQLPRLKACSTIVGFLLVATASLSASTQNTTNAASEKVKNATQQGFQLTNVSSTDVTSNISVEASLIPANIAKVVFGKEVSNNYAVIALTISNRSSDDAFIVHSIFVDYSQWLMSGTSPFRETNALCMHGSVSASGPQSAATQETTQSSQNSASPQPSGQNANSPEPSSTRNATTQNCSNSGNQLQPWQQQTLPNQIASIEGRIVRGQLLARQPWTTRNWVLRALQAAGSIATGFTFVTSSQSWIRGIGAFNGSGVPAAQTFWPDDTINQMNEISNVGFQVNKVISKQSSDIIVAFFPIERFLTPDLKSIFLSSPAAFFSPVAALLDPQTQNKLDPYLVQIFRGKDTKEALMANMLKYLPQFGTEACEEYKTSEKALDAATGLEQACLTATVVNRLSLNTVRLIVGGTMTVDVNSVPPQITGVEIQSPPGETATSMWTLKSGSHNATLNGTIRGSFLGGGTPVLVTPPSGVTIKAVTTGSTDTALQFALTFTSTLPGGTKLTFQVTKSASSGSTIKSATYDYQLEGPSQPDVPQGGTNITPSPAPIGSAPANPDKPGRK